MMSIQMQRAFDRAAEYDKTLLATDPRIHGFVSICHDDGSSFNLSDAFAMWWNDPEGERWLFVFAEHHGPFVFAEDDICKLNCLKSFVRLETLEGSTTPP